MSFETTAAIARAENFWIQVEYVVENRGHGRPGNQIDLARGSRVFFGFSGRRVPRNTALGDVSIRFARHRSLTHMRFGNNYMDKLNLPIPGEGGPPDYSHTVLLFTRQSDGGFRMRVGTPDEARAWRRRSRSQETLFRMRGGREYGVFS